MLRLLLADKRVDPTLERSDGVSPLFVAARNGYEEAVAVLLPTEAAGLKTFCHIQKFSNGQTPTTIARERGHKAVTKALEAACAK